MSLESTEIKKNYKDLLGQIQKATLASKALEPRIVAVSKKQSIGKVKAVYELGQRDFGESYCQEMEEKERERVRLGLEGLRWTFVGRLQSNKIRKIVSLASEVQSLGTFKHAELINRYAFELKKNPYKVYLLVNSANEPSKGGFSWGELSSAQERIRSELPNLSVQGLMAIPPKVELEREDKAFYEKLYAKIAKESRGVGLGLLSLGMSSDIELALRCGSDCLRVGSKIFGKRE